MTLSEEVAAELLAGEEKTQFVLFEDMYNFVIAASAKDKGYKTKNFEALSELREFYEDKL